MIKEAKIPRYPSLNKALREQLAMIEPSVNGGVLYYPVSAVTEMGIVRCVYIVEEQGYFQQWGVWPEDDIAKMSISISDVQCVMKSPSRLPSQYVDTILAGGEAGMGYHIFTIEYNNGTKQTITSGSALDFVNYPEGLCADDIVDVRPTYAEKGHEYYSPPEYAWSLYSSTLSVSNIDEL